MLLIKIKQQDSLLDGKSVSDSSAYLEEYIYDICLIISSTCQLACTYRLILQACAKLSAFEYENKASRESNNYTERLNWSFFKETPYRNPKPVNNLT